MLYYESCKIRPISATQPVAIKELYYLVHQMRGSDILFFQCRAKNSTHLAYGLQAGGKAQKHHCTLMFWYFKSPIISFATGSRQSPLC